MKYRIKITQAAALIFFLIAKPNSWFLFFLGMAAALMGELIRLWSAGNISKDKVLAVNGPYKMVRNPLYAGSLLIALGFAIACINFEYPLRTIGLLLVMFLGFKFIYSVQIKSEEKHLENLFGEEYKIYKAQIPSFMPNLLKFKEAARSSLFSWKQATKNKEFVSIMGFLAAALFLAAKLKYKL